MGTKVYLCDLGLPDGMSLDIPGLSQCLSQERQEKIKARRFEKDKLQVLGAGILLDMGLKEYGLREKDAAIVYGDNQKPYLKDYPVIHFNLSHSGTMAMAVFSDREAGCDVEQVREARMGVARRYFTQAEQTALESQPTQEAKNQLFFQIWTLKESYLKATGEGMRLPLKSFSVHPVPTPLNYTFQLFPLPGYQSAICLKSAPAAPSEEVFFSFQNLLDVV